MRAPPSRPSVYFPARFTRRHSRRPLSAPVTRGSMASGMRSTLAVALLAAFGASAAANKNHPKHKPTPMPTFSPAGSPTAWHPVRAQRDETRDARRAGCPRRARPNFFRVFTAAPNSATVSAGMTNSRGRAGVVAHSIYRKTATLRSHAPPPHGTDGRHAGARPHFADSAHPPAGTIVSSFTSLTSL